MSKHTNKAVQSIIVYERGGKTADYGCVRIANVFEVGATTAKDALAIMARLYGNSRRFYVPNEQVHLNPKPKYDIATQTEPSAYEKYMYPTFQTKVTRTRSRQRRTSLPHGEHMMPRGTVVQH